jgi:hypothetical protein
MKIKKTNTIFLVIMIILVILLSSKLIFAASNQGTYVDALNLNINLLNQTPDPIRAGGIVDLKFGITNMGSIGVTDLTATLDFDYPFSIIPGEDYQKNINKIFPFQDQDNSQILKYKLLVDKDAPSGIYNVSLRIKRSTTEITSIYNFEVKVTSKEYAQIITINKANVDFGTIEKLDFVIINTGYSPIRNIVFSWSDQTETILPVNSDNTKYIKYLDIEESITVSYNVMANTNSIPGLYKLNLLLEFENEEYTKTQINTTAGIFVGGKTDFDVTLSQGDLSNVSLSIANIGNNPAYSVNVIIPNQTNYTVSGQNSTILGNLDKGDYTIASFTLNQSRTIGDQNIAKETQTFDSNTDRILNRTNQGKLKIVIEYTDSLGNRNTVEKEIETQLITTNLGTTADFTGRVGTKTTKNYTTTYVLIGITIIIVLLFGYNKYKKNKLKNQKSK